MCARLRVHVVTGVHDDDRRGVRRAHQVEVVQAVRQPAARDNVEACLRSQRIHNLVKVLLGLVRQQHDGARGAALSLRLRPLQTWRAPCVVCVAGS